MDSNQVKGIEAYLIFAIIFLTGYAIFAFGLTTEGTKEVFDYGLGGILLAWVLSLLCRRRKPAVRTFALILPLFLLSCGWVSVLNAGFNHNWESGFKAIEGSTDFKWLPSSLNRDRSERDMIHLSLLIFGFWMISDLCRNRGNRRILLISIAMIGLVFSICGIFQKASGSETILFHDEVWTGRTTFTSYRYHGNAATFLNFCWPIAFVLLLRSALRRSSPLSLSVFACAAFFTFASLFVNTSKMGQFAAPVLLLVFLVAYRKQIGTLLKGFPHRRLIGIMLSIAFLAIIVSLVGLSFTKSLERWKDLDGSLEGRVLVYETSPPMIKAAGAFGMGPGTFSTAFPYFLAAERKDPQVFFYYAHQDYIQCLVEWGWLGFGVWMSLFLLVVFTGLRGAASGSFYSSAILLGILIAALQALVDFPAQIASLQWVGVILSGALVSPRRSGSSRKL